MKHVDESNSVSLPVEKESFLRKIATIVDDLEASDFVSCFWTTLHQGLSKIQCNPVSVSEIVCFGLGSICDSKVSQYQLALLLILANKFQCTVETYDPVFSKTEREILSDLNLVVPTHNSKGKRTACKGASIFLLPHCPRELTNNLLYSNWAIENLPNCVIIGNSFSHLKLTTPKRLLNSYHYVVQAEEVATELPITNNYKFRDIFNDLSLHVFPLHSITNLEANFWNCVEPVYDNESELLA
nr:EOG090X0FII [Cyclestheria hislopi]